jgi:sarcosine oxidase subunit beta
MGRVYVPTVETFPKTADVAVIGGGIVGVSTAFWLSRAGLDTVLVEMRDGLSTLSTASSVECFRAQFTEPAMAELARSSNEIFEEFARVVGVGGLDIALHQQGYLFLTDDPAMVDELEAAVHTHHALGVTDSQFLSAGDIQRRYPYVSPSAVGGTFRQRDGWLSAHEATQGFARGSSARFLLQTRASGIAQDGHGVSGVHTTQGTIATRTVVDAAGPFAGQVARLAGLDLPLGPVRRQKVFLSSQPLVPADAPMSIDVGRECYWRPETGGAYIAWVDPDEPVSEPAEDLPTDWDYPAIVLDNLVDMWPFWGEVSAGLRKADIHLSAGQYVYTPDDQPLIGPVPELPGFYVNCGYWAGVMLSPAAGRRVADLVTGAMAPQDNPLRPTRFEEGMVTESGSFLRGRH